MGKSKRIWRDSQHPRDDRGRFARTGGAAWIKRATAELTSAPTAGNTRSAGGRPMISRSAKAGVVLQAHADGGRPSAVRVPQAVKSAAPKVNLTGFMAKGLPTPVKRAAPPVRNLDAFNAPDPPTPADSGLHETVDDIAAKAHQASMAAAYASHIDTARSLSGVRDRLRMGDGDLAAASGALKAIEDSHARTYGTSNQTYKDVVRLRQRSDALDKRARGYASHFLNGSGDVEPTDEALAADLAGTVRTPGREEYPQIRHALRRIKQERDAALAKRTPRPASGAAALIAARQEEQAPHVPAMIAARTEPVNAPSAGAAGYAAMRRHTLVSLARTAGVRHQGRSNTEIGEDLAKKDAEVKASRAAKLNPAGVGQVDTPSDTPQTGGVNPTTPRKRIPMDTKREVIANAHRKAEKDAIEAEYRANEDAATAALAAQAANAAPVEEPLSLRNMVRTLDLPLPQGANAVDYARTADNLAKDGKLDAAEVELQNGMRATGVTPADVKRLGDILGALKDVRAGRRDRPKAEAEAPAKTPDVAPEATPGADTEHLKRPKAKKGDLVVVERKTSSYTVGKDREEGADVIVGVVTSTNRDGIVTGFSRNADGSHPEKVGNRDRTLKLEQERVDVQGAMAAAAANPWPHDPSKTGKPFASLAEARAAVAPHLGDQSANVKADAAAKRAAAKRRPASEAKVTEAATAMRQEKDYAKALRLIDEGEAADPGYKDKQGRGWGDFRTFVTAQRDRAARDEARRKEEDAGPKESAADLAIGKDLYQRFISSERTPFDYGPSTVERNAAEQRARDEVESLLSSGIVFNRDAITNRLARAEGAVAAFKHQREAKRAEVKQARELIAKIEDPEYKKLNEREVLRKLEHEEDVLTSAIHRQESDAARARADFRGELKKGGDKLVARRRSDATDRARTIANQGGRGYGDSGAGAKIVAKYGTRPSSADLKAMSANDRGDAQSELIMRGAHQDDLSKIVRSPLRNVDTKTLTPEQRQAWTDATDAPTRDLVHTLAARQRRDLALSRLAKLEAHEDRPSDAPELRAELDAAIAQERANLDYAQGELSTLEPEFQANLDRIETAVNTVRATAGLKPAKLNRKGLDTAYAKRVDSHGITRQENPPAPPAPSAKTPLVTVPRKQLPRNAKVSAVNAANAKAAPEAEGIDALVKAVPDNRAAGTGKDRSGMMDQARNPRILAEQWAAAMKTGDKQKASNAFVAMVHGIRLNGTGSREDRQALIERLGAEHDKAMGGKTPEPEKTTPRTQAYSSFSQRMAGDMSNADRLAAVLRNEEERQKLRARETERARQIEEARLNDTRPEREKLAEQLQQDRDVDRNDMRSGRRNPQRLARIKKLEARIEEIDTEARKAKIKPIRKGDKVKTSLGEFEVVSKTKEGYLRVVRPDGRRGSVDPKHIESVTPAPKADAAQVAAPARARITPDAKRAALDKANADATAAKRAANLEKARAAATAQHVDILKRSDDPKDNSAKINAIRDGRMESADLYRQIMAGPSGQRSRHKVGRVRYTPDNHTGEYTVTAPGGERVGYATSVVRDGDQKYAVYSENYDGGTELLGWADTLAHATDVLTNGEAAASTGGTLDARRISGRLFERNPNRDRTPEELNRRALDREIAQVREELANPRIGPQMRTNAARRLAALEAERQGAPETPVDTPRVKSQNGGMTNARHTTIKGMGLKDGDQVRVHLQPQGDWVEGKGYNLGPRDPEGKIVTVRSRVNGFSLEDGDGNVVTGGGVATKYHLSPVGDTATAKPSTVGVPAAPAGDTEQVAATSIKKGDTITVKGVTLTVADSPLYEGRYVKPGASRMTNLVGFDHNGETIWVAAHVKVAKHVTPPATPAGGANEPATRTAWVDERGRVVHNPSQVEIVRGQVKRVTIPATPAPEPAGVGPGKYRLNATDAEVAAARPRMEGESDFAYSVRRAPDRGAALSILNGHQVGGLRAIARAEGVVVTSKDTKASLVERLIRALYDRHADSRAITEMVNRDRTPAKPPTQELQDIPLARQRIAGREPIVDSVQAIWFDVAFGKQTKEQGAAKVEKLAAQFANGTPEERALAAHLGKVAQEMRDKEIKPRTNTPVTPTASGQARPSGGLESMPLATQRGTGGREPVVDTVARIRASVASGQRTPDEGAEAMEKLVLRFALGTGGPDMEALADELGRIAREMRAGDRNGAPKPTMTGSELLAARRAAQAAPQDVDTPPAADPRAAKLAAKRAELEAAQKRLRAAADYHAGGSMRTKTFAVRMDAALRRGGEAGRDIERLQREIAALERPEAPKAGPVNFDDIKVGGIIKRNGSLYRVLKVNAKSVKVEMPPGWDDVFKKDHKITEVHPPKK